MEVEADERDRQREMEEIEEIRKQIVDTQSEEMDEQVRTGSIGYRAGKFILILIYVRLCKLLSDPSRQKAEYLFLHLAS